MRYNFRAPQIPADFLKTWIEVRNTFPINEVAIGDFGRQWVRLPPYHPPSQARDALGRQQCFEGGRN